MAGETVSVSGRNHEITGVSLGGALDRTVPKDAVFPMKIAESDRAVAIHGGLTRRELFAAMAMQGWLSNFSDGHARQVFVSAGTGKKSTHAEMCAEEAVFCADALIAELAKGKS